MVTRDDVIAYLLHRLPDEARATLAEQSLADPELHEQLQLTEAELLDAYVRDTASPEDRRAIELHLLASDYQRDKLAFAEALKIALPSAPDTRRRPREHAGWMTWAAAAAIVMLAGGSVWLARENRALREQIAAPAAPRPTSATPSQTQTRVEPITGVGGLVVIPIAANDLRGGGGPPATVVIPTGATVVRFDLDLDIDDGAEAYTVTLTTGGGVAWREEPVRRASNVAAPVLSFLAPATVLTPGSYEISVTAGGRPVAFFPVHIAVP